jgi:hypothetical protein
MIVLALVFTLIAALIWFAFLRPAPVQTAFGVIRSKSYKPAGHYWQEAVGSRDGFRTPTRISIAECYIFGILVDGRPGEARIACNIVEARTFNVGQKVQVKYVERGLPPIWKRIFVTDMKVIQ